MTFHLELKEGVYSPEQLADKAADFLREHETTPLRGKTFVVDTRSAVEAVLTSEYPDAAYGDLWAARHKALGFDPARGTTSAWERIYPPFVPEVAQAYANWIRVIAGAAAQHILENDPGYAGVYGIGQDRYERREAILASQLVNAR
jgi:hypothetical protein